jgi:phage terminase small subunit
MENELKPRHQAFAEAVASGISYAKAVEIAGYRSRGIAAGNQGTKLMKNKAVRAGISRLQALATNDSIMTAIEAKQALTRLIKVAESEQDFTGFSTLVDRLSKMNGFYSPKLVDTSSRVSIVIGGEDSG